MQYFCTVSLCCSRAGTEQTQELGREKLTRDCLLHGVSVCVRLELPKSSLAHPNARLSSKINYEIMASTIKILNNLRIHYTCWVQINKWRVVFICLLNRGCLNILYPRNRACIQVKTFANNINTVFGMHITH